MFKKTARFTAISAFLLFMLIIGIQPAWAQPAFDRQILLTPGETTAEVNGEPVELDAPAVIADGHTLVPLRFVGEALAASVHWDPADRSVVVQSPDHRVYLQIDNPAAWINNVETGLAVAPQIRDGRTMVPLRFVSEALEAEVGFEPEIKLITIILKTRDRLPIAAFSFEPDVIAPGDTPAVVNHSRHPLGLIIVHEEWTGLEKHYDVGTYEVTLRVEDESGVWSEPFTRTLRVKEPPTAAFRTEKSTYRTGEPIVYINRSTDPEGRPLTLTWEAEPVYFEPGEYEARLTVTNEYGLSSTATETLVITDRAYYTKEEYYLLYGKDGGVVPYEEDVLKFPVLEPEVTANTRTLLRVNSPEEIREQGILYRDTAVGPTRIMVHHLNRMAEPIHIHALVHNPSEAPTTVRITRGGIGGPAGDILRLGRLHLEQFFAPQAEQIVTVPAGATVNLLKGLSGGKMKPNDCFTGMWDLEVSAPLEFTFIALKDQCDPLQQPPEGLPQLAADDKHIRGTFPDADRVFRLETVAAGERARVILADTTLDPPAEGVDALTGRPVQNTGNYGVVYRLDFNPLPGRTALLLNPRGGNFCGALKIGGKTASAPATGYIPPQRCAQVLYKSEASRPVTLEFSPPAGSYLPVNILSVPMPTPKGEPGPLIPDK